MGRGAAQGGGQRTLKDFIERVAPPGAALSMIRKPDGLWKCMTVVSNDTKKETRIIEANDFTSLVSALEELDSKMNGSDS
jgi:hypothetical protein